MYAGHKLWRRVEYLKVVILALLIIGTFLLYLDIAEALITADPVDESTDFSIDGGTAPASGTSGSGLYSSCPSTIINKTANETATVKKIDTFKPDSVISLFFLLTLLALIFFIFRKKKKEG